MALSSSSDLHRPSWRPVWKDDAERPKRRWKRRLLALSAVIAALAVLAYAVLRPFWHPRPYLALVGALDYAPLAAPPLPYRREDLAAFAELAPALADGGAPPTIALNNRDDLDRLGDRLRRAVAQGADVAIVYLAAQGVSHNEEAYLWGNDWGKPGAPGARIPLRDALQTVSQCGAKIKVVLLDSGNLTHDRREGIAVNAFAHCLQRQVPRLGDPSLWVIASCDGFQPAQVSPALRRSAFGYFTAQALRGGADANGDRVVDLGELHRFVSANVRAFVAASAGDAAQQTPLLVWGGGEGVAPKNPRLLSVAPFAAQAAQEDVRQAIAVARKTSGRSYLGYYVPTAGETAARATAKAMPSSGVAGRALRLGSQASAEFQAVGGNGQAAETPPPAEGGANGAATPTATSPESTAAAANGPASPGAGAAAAEPEEAGSTADANLTRAATLLATAWQLRDQLQTMEGAGVSRPLDDAPHLWRAAEERLVAWEQMFRAGIGDEPALLAELQSAVNVWTALADPSADRPPLKLAEETAVQRYRELAPRPAPAKARARSLALELHLVSAAGDAAANLQDLADRLRGFAEGGQREAFLAWTDALSDDDLRFREVWFARRLSLLPAVDWPMLRLALQVCLAEAAAATVAPETVPWVREQVAAADAVRCEGERELFDRVGAEAAERASRLLRQSLDRYAAASRDAATVRAAIRLHNDLCARAPLWVQWFAVSSLAGRTPSSPPPRFGELRELLVALTALAAELDAPSATRLPELERLAQRLQALQARVEAGLQPGAIDALAAAPAQAGKALASERLLGTPLLTAEQRLHLLRALPALDEAVVSRYGTIAFPGSPPALLPPTRDDWRRVGQRAELEFLLARLAASQLGREDDDAPALLGVRREWDALTAAALPVMALAADDPPAAAPRPAFEPEAGVQETWDRCAAFGDALARFYARLPESLPATLREANLNSAAARPAALRQLHAAARALRFVASRDAAQLDAAPLAHTLAAAQWRDAWLWRRTRWLAAMDDAPAAERAFLRDAAHHDRLQAEAIAFLPAVPDHVRPNLEIESVTVASLAENPTSEWDVTLRLQGASQAAVWLVLKYDPALLDVHLRPEDRAVRELARRADRGSYPYRPDRLGEPPTFILRSGAPQTVRLRAAAVGASAAPARLIVKALAVDPAGRAGAADALLAYRRQEIEVALPLPQTMDLLVEGQAGAWTPTEDGVALHPFPNRATPYRLLLANRLAHARQADVALLVPSRWSEQPLPAAELSAAAANDLLARLAVGSPILEIKNLTLPPHGEPVSLPFPPSPDAPAPAGGTAPPPEPPGLPPAPAAGSPEAPPGVVATPLAAPAPIPREILVAVTDRETGSTWMRRLRVKPQHPRRYVRPEVSYDPQQERVEIRIVADDPSLAPPGGTQVQCNFAPPLAPSAEARRSGVVGAPNFAADLYAEVTSREPTTLTIDVDGYPRAFVFRIDPLRPGRNLPEDADALAARIVELPQGVKYPASAAQAPVVVEIDAPPGAFASAGDVVEIGIDKDRDREFVGDSPLVFHSARQVTATLERIAPGGTFVVGTEATDFRVVLPDPGLHNARANILAHVVVGGREAWSEPVEAVFDAAPPVVQRLELTPGREVPLGGAVEVRLWCDDRALSGVAKVEAAWDVTRTGELPAEPPPAAAVPWENGLWVAKLPAAVAGTYTLLVRTTDEVGNAQVTRQGKVRIITPEEAAAAEAAKTNRVAGVVVYGEQPQANIEVTLESETGQALGPLRTNAQGEFEFPRVPLGKYKVAAAGLVRGARRVYPHDGQDKIVTVEAPPKVVSDLRLPLKLPRAP